MFGELMRDTSIRVKEFKHLQPYRLYYFDNKFIVTNGHMLLYRKAKDKEWSVMTIDLLKKWGDKYVKCTDDFDYDLRA